MTQQEEILSGLQNILSVKMGIPESEVSMDTNLSDDIGLDSLDQIEMSMEAEKLFNVVIPDDEAERFETVGDVVRSIDGKIQKPETNFYS